MTKTIGYLVVEKSEDFEQVLSLERDPAYPAGGLLVWPTKHRAMFPDRKSALAAISRTEYYLLAFGIEPGIRFPEKRFCSVVSVVAADSQGDG